MESFNNNTSHCTFIGERKLEDVIARDVKELTEMGGSFNAIADRMSQIIAFAKQSKDFPIDFEDKIIVLSYVLTRGMQECPFSRECKIGGYNGWNEDIRIKSKTTGRGLTINSGTSHLAKKHHLLEKDNEYGISAREFYKSFM